ncbi:hypothetical protein C1646_753014 [Rhizophagus diaphanus]|nr:hypothetical protein C1646_753014 [Rhizophagus diaphanus] [Rhizophagus sp. MUCL 43196]
MKQTPLELVKRETQFLLCGSFPPEVLGLDVKITTDPVVPNTEETRSPYCGYCSLPGVTCLIKAGTAFSTTQKYTAPKELPKTYNIRVEIGHGQPPNVEQIACAGALVVDNKPSADFEVWDFL